MPWYGGEGGSILFLEDGEKNACLIIDIEKGRVLLGN